MLLLPELLNVFDATLKKYNPSNYKKLQDPLSDKELNLILSKINVYNHDFITFYKWKNGFNQDQEDSFNCQIFNIDIMLSLNWIYEKVNINKSTGSKWDNSFIPLLSNNTGEYVLFNNKKGRNYGKLYFISSAIMSAIKPISCYDSISAMIQTTIKAYEHEVLKYDLAEDWLNVDVDKYYKIAKSFNKKCKYWFT